MSTSLSVLAALSLTVAVWYAYWQYHARKLQESGHTAPDSSAFAKLFYAGACKLAALLTIGPVKVIGKKNAPSNGKLLIVANHQVPTDFAMVAAGVQRHYRALGDAAQFPGFFGVISAWVGIISVTFKTKAERAAGEAGAVRVLAAPRRSPFTTRAVVLVAAILGAYAVCFAYAGMALVAWALGICACAFLCLPGGDTALVIAPQGALMPDNVLKKEEFRAGAVRVACAAALQSGETVRILPLGIHYKRDPKDAHWSHRFLAKTRSMFPTLRNPRHWDPLFKLNLDELSAGERSEVEAKRAAALHAYKNSNAPIYGGVVVVGEAIELSSLPEEPTEAIEVIRLKIAELVAIAEKH